MYHPTTRVLTVLELLQSRRQMSGPELAERLEVDIRTVRRYIVMLQELGIPVEGVRGCAGAYRLRPGFKLPPLMFQEDEALAVLLGLLAARRLGLAQPPAAVESVLAKIERVLPAALRERGRAVQETLVLALPQETVPATGQTIVTLSTAAQQGRQVWLRYRAWAGEETERMLDPYGLVFRAGRWYVVGYCHLRQAVRVFRLERIQVVALTAETFIRPPDLDLLAEVEHSIAQTPGAWQVEVLLQMTLEEAQRHVPPTFALLEQSPSGVVLHWQGRHLGEIAHFLAGLGCPLVIRQPPELRDELQRLAEHVSKLAAAPL